MWTIWEDWVIGLSKFYHVVVDKQECITRYWVDGELIYTYQNDWDD